MRVFDTDQRGGRIVDVLSADPDLDLPEGEDAFGSVHGPRLYPRDDGGGARLVLDDVALLAQDPFASPGSPGEKRELIAEGSRGDEEGGFLAHELRGERFEPVHRGIVAVDIVSHGGFGH